ncbi:MAG: 6-hydroxymethylpterin diphosphokinase MptE-like protein [Candidatus Sigynarchaeota archaeon]
MAIEDVTFPPLARSYYASCFQRIKQSLPLDFNADVTTRDFLEHELGRFGVTKSGREAIGSLQARRKKTCIVSAPGPTLESRIDALASLLKMKDRPMAIISVDGAARLLMDKGISTDFVVTDLDGLTTDDVINLHDEWHATIVVHGHGDNLPAVKALLESASPDERYVFTTQVEPTLHVCNLGGFTDGDRAVFVGLAFGFTRLVLVAMDLDANTIGTYSKPMRVNTPDSTRATACHPIKRRKLQVALSTLRWLAREAPPGCRIQTFQKLPPFDFLENITRLEELAG